MKKWKKISLFVCVFAFVREFRPIEPFYAAYMTSPAINITLTQVKYYTLYTVNSYTLIEGYNISASLKSNFSTFSGESKNIWLWT